MREFPEKNLVGGGGRNIFAHKSFIGKYFSDKRHLHTHFKAYDSRWVYEGSTLESIRKILQRVAGMSACMWHLLGIFN
jgi:hypothetical protein